MSTNTESTADAQPEDDIDNLEIEADPEGTVEEDATDATTNEEVDGEANIDSEPAADLTDEQDTSEESIAEASDEADAEDETEEESVLTGPPERFQAAILGGELKNFVSTLRVIVDEAKLTVGSDGITSRAVDPANVAMYDLELSAAAFESYESGDGLLGVNLERFESVLKLAKKDDLVQVSFDTSTYKLLIVIDGVEFTMACIDPDSIRQEPEIPEMELPISLTVGGSQISRAVKAADMVSDHIGFRCVEADETVFIEAEGDTDDVSLRLTADEYESLDAVDGRALFSLDYIKNISKKLPKTDDVTLTFGDQFPMLVDYEIADGECSVAAMVAPRIET